MMPRVLTNTVLRATSTCKDSHLGNEQRRRLCPVCLYSCSYLERMCLEGAVPRAASSAKAQPYQDEVEKLLDSDISEQCPFNQFLKLA